MEVFSALADPTRLRIVELLAESDRDAGSIAAEFHVSRPAVSRHLRVLREAEVVESRTEGKRRVYRLRAETFDEIDQWVSRYRTFWSRRPHELEGSPTSSESVRRAR